MKKQPTVSVPESELIDWLKEVLAARHPVVAFDEDEQAMLLAAYRKRGHTLHELCDRIRRFVPTDKQPQYPLEP